MNYAMHYERLMARARNRVLEGYCEHHHVMPQCLGGGNERTNIIELTPEEHYVAHLLLVKMYPGVHGLVVVVVLMAKNLKGSRAYGWVKRRHSEAMRGNKRCVGRRLPQESLRKRSQSLMGRKFSEETRRKISQSAMGHKRCVGRKLSKQTRAKIGAGRRAAWQRSRQA